MVEGKSIVFVVDDDPSIRESLSLLLSSAGYSVATFASAKEFLESEHSTSGPACLVLDVKMPGLSGLDLQQELTSMNYIHTGHLYNRSRRHSYECAGDEEGGNRFSFQAF